MVESASQKRVGIIFVMLDGVADNCNGSDKLTPLQKAKIPTMDAIASQNIYGLHDPV